jgi:hypothetical protein
MVDARLVRAAVLAPLAVAPPLVALGALTEGMSGVYAVLWALATIGLTAYAVAAVSARGGRTSRGIGVVRVTAAVPLRLVAIAAMLAIAVGPLGFPSRVVALALCVGEIAVLSAQSWIVLRGRTFVGPMTGKA